MDKFGTEREETSPSGLFQHIDHLGLENVIHRLYADRRTGLWHSKDVDDLNSVFVDKLAQHQTHDFHRDTSASVFQHLYVFEKDRRISRIPLAFNKARDEM